MVKRQPSSGGPANESASPEKRWRAKTLTSPQKAASPNKGAHLSPKKAESPNTCAIKFQPKTKDEAMLFNDLEPGEQKHSETKSVTERPSGPTQMKRPVAPMKRPSVHSSEKKAPRLGECVQWHQRQSPG